MDSDFDLFQGLIDGVNGIAVHHTEFDRGVRGYIGFVDGSWAKIIFDGARWQYFSSLRDTRLPVARRDDVRQLLHEDHQADRALVVGEVQLTRSAPSMR